MACHFAYARSDLVTAVGAVGGLRVPDLPAPPRPVPVLAFHGTADRVNPYEGGGAEYWGEGVQAAARRWAAANGLPLEAQEDSPTPTLTRTRYGPDGAPGEVVLWTVRGGGHTWPGGRTGLAIRLLLGRTTRDVDATARIAAFAALHTGRP